MPFEGSLIERLSGLVAAGIRPEARFLLALIAGTVLFAILALPALVVALRRMPRSARIGVVLALALAISLRRFLFPDMPIHENFHLPMVLDRIANALHMDIAMGRGFSVLFNVIGRLFGGGEPLLFDVQRLFGAASVVLLAALAFTVTASGLTAFSAALLLAANPIHARLSASEDPSVVFVFLILSATVSVVLAARGGLEEEGPRTPRRRPLFLLLHAGFALALSVHLRSDFAVYALVPIAMAWTIPGGIGRIARMPAAWVAVALFALSVTLVLHEVVHPRHDGFRWVTRPDALLEALVEAWDPRAPNRVVLLAQSLSPPLIVALAAVGILGLARTNRRLAWALGLLGLAYTWLFLGSNGFPGNVRHQAPHHFLFLLAAASGASLLVTGPFPSRGARAVAVGAFIAVALVSFGTTTRMLTRPASPYFEREFLTTAWSRIPVGPGTTFVRLQGGVDTGFVNTTFPDDDARRAGADLAPISRMLADASTMDEEALRPFVFYRGLSCYLASTYGQRAYGPCENPCRLLDEAFDLRPIVEREIPNIPYESMFTYPSPSDQPMLKIGFYRMFPKEPVPAAP